MSHRFARTLAVTTLSVIAAGSLIVAYLLRFGGVVPEARVPGMIALSACAIGVKLFAFCWHRLDQGVNRYIGFHDLLTIARATTYSTIGLTAVDALLLPGSNAPRGVLLIDWGATLVAVGLFRSVPRAWRDLRAQLDRKPGRRVLIVGANDSGEALLRSVRGDQSAGLRPVAFLDDEPRRLGQHIGGVPVVGSPSELGQHVARLAVEEVLVAGGLSGKLVRSVMSDAESAGVPVRVLPTYEQLLRGHVDVRPREVAIEDLLRREPVRLDEQAIGAWLRGRTVMVTGSAGSIGSEICRQLLRHRPGRLVALDRSETGQFFLERELQSVAPAGVEVEVVLADTTDADRIDSVFEAQTPDVVFHAAAYKHVPLMERHPGEAVKNIVLATQNVADAAERHGAGSFVMVSTDKAVNPTSVMGACKQVAERYVQAKSVGSDCRFVTVRFGNVLDSAGSVIPIFRKQIAEGGPVTVTHADINRYFMMIPEAAQLVVQSGVMGGGGEIFVLDMGEPVRIYDLARDMIRLSGLREGDDIEIAVTGLRPGEKLYEELYNESERHATTTHPKIMSADSRPEPLVAMISHLRRLAEAADEDGAATIEALEDVAPRLQSGLPRRVAA